jgi:hypothetical protein
MNYCKKPCTFKVVTQRSVISEYLKFKEAVMHSAYARCLCVRVRHLILDMAFHLLRNYAKMSLPLEGLVAVHIKNPSH